jgi:hypothetical protein
LVHGEAVQNGGIEFFLRLLHRRDSVGDSAGLVALVGGEPASGRRLIGCLVGRLSVVLFAGGDHDRDEFPQGVRHLKCLVEAVRQFAADGRREDASEDGLCLRRVVVHGF